MPEPIKVIATKNSNAVEVTYNFGSDLDEMVQLFGKEIVFGAARQSLKINLQALLRRGLEAGKSQEEIRAEAAAWVPGVAGPRRSAVDPTTIITQKWAQLSEEARKAVLTQLRSMM